MSSKLDRYNNMATGETVRLDASYVPKYIYRQNGLTTRVIFG